MICERCGHNAYIFKRVPYHSRIKYDDQEINMRLTKKCTCHDCNCSHVICILRNGISISGESQVLWVKHQPEEKLPKTTE